MTGQHGLRDELLWFAVLVATTAILYPFRAELHEARITLVLLLVVLGAGAIDQLATLGAEALAAARAARRAHDAFGASHRQACPGFGAAVRMHRPAVRVGNQPRARAMAHRVQRRAALPQLGAEIPDPI